MKRAILSLSLFLFTIGLYGVTPTVEASIDPGDVSGKTGIVEPVGAAACKSVMKEKINDCEGCFNGGGVWTAVGCLGGESPAAFVTSFIQLGTGLGGGIAMMLILFSGFQRIMSAGNPEKLHEAKELMTAAISGLLLIIFSIFLLRLIGVDILQIPGLG